MSWLTEHAQRISDWQRGIAERNENWIPKGWRGGMAPGSPMSLVDAIALDKWSKPYGGEPNSMDVYFGGGSAVNPGSEGRWARGVGRGVGTIAAILTGAEALGLGGEAGAGTGAGESFGLTGMEGGASTVPYDTGMVTGASGSGYAPVDEFGNLYGTYGSTGGNAAGGGFNWNQFFGRGGAGNVGIGGLMMLLNARNQRENAKEGEEDEQAAVQQGTNAMARSLSTEGNPAGSGRAQQELQNYATVALARYRAARRARMAEAENNMFGAGGVSLQALLAALAQSGAFGSGSSGSA